MWKEEKKNKQSKNKLQMLSYYLSDLSLLRSDLGESYTVDKFFATSLKPLYLLILEDLRIQSSAYEGIRVRSRVGVSR